MTEAALALAPALAIGSFLNVLVARIPQHLPLTGRSGCMSCGEQIAWYDNIPVASYLVLHGRCRSCGTRISPLYPAVELSATLLIAASIWRFGLTPYGLLAAFFCSVLVVLSAIDVRHRIVPNRIVLPAAGITLVAHTAIDPSVEWVAAAAAASAFFLAAALIYPAGLGLGDVKLALLLGAMLGRTVAIGLFIGLVSALVPSLVLFVRHGRKARKMTIPFVPFLAFGGLVALFFGSALLDWYLGASG